MRSAWPAKQHALTDRGNSAGMLLSKASACDARGKAAVPPCGGAWNQTWPQRV